MLRSIALTAALALSSALPAFAQSELERMEAATVAASLNMEAFMVSRAPSLADAMPDWTWGDDMRAAGSCTLDAIRAEGGDAAAEDYIDALEAFAVLEITSMEQLATAAPVPISSDFAVATSQRCGSDDVAMQRMEASGLMEAMLDPQVMMQLMGQ